MKMKDFDSKIVNELEKDVNRLEKIADRFSKIGSIPKLKSASIVEVLQNSVSYLEHRFSGRIRMQLNLPDKDILVLLNVPLFEWVIENTCRNAYDAMGGEGIISIYCRQHKYKVYIDICDTGKGIPKSKQKTIFKPGFTTKKTGWGLGLSLSKRIIEEYHHGKIFVLNSELGKGTTLRISLNTLLV